MRARGYGGHQRNKASNVPGLMEYVNSKGPWKHAQGLQRSVPGAIPAPREVGQCVHLLLRSCCQLITTWKWKTSFLQQSLPGDGNHFYWQGLGPAVDAQHRLSSAASWASYFMLLYGTTSLCISTWQVLSAYIVTSAFMFLWDSCVSLCLYALGKVCQACSTYRQKWFIFYI